MPNHPHHEDAPGADAGDGSAPGAPLLEVTPCELDPAAVDLVNHRDPRHPDRWHFSAAEWAAFAAELKPPAGPPPEPGRAP